MKWSQAYRRKADISAGCYGLRNKVETGAIVKHDPSYAYIPCLVATRALIRKISQDLGEMALLAQDPPFRVTKLVARGYIMGLSEAWLFVLLCTSYLFIQKPNYVGKMEHLTKNVGFECGCYGGCYGLHNVI